MKKLGLHQIDTAGALPGQTPVVNESGGIDYATPVGSIASGELLMQDGASSPPAPLETEDGTDWLYQG